MPSSNQIQAGRDAANYDDDRKEGRYSAGGDRAAYFPAVSDWGMRDGDAEKAAVIAKALSGFDAAIERDREAARQARVVQASLYVSAVAA